MKKLFYACSLALAAVAFGGCSNSSKDAKESADSLNKVKDTTSNVMATGGIAVDESDAKFATEAASGGMAEVALGKLALEKSSNARVKEFATMMVSDHGKVNEELKNIAQTKNITLPTAIDADHQKKADELSKLSGADFDKKYVEAMVDGHQKTLKLMQDEAKDGKDATLKAFAGKTAPVVQTHLDAINKIHDSLK